MCYLRTVTQSDCVPVFNQLLSLPLYLLMISSKCFSPNWWTVPLIWLLESHRNHDTVFTGCVTSKSLTCKNSLTHVVPCDPLSGLGMENIGGIFVVLICGLIIAVFVAIMEFVWSTRRSAETDEVCPHTCPRRPHRHTPVGSHGIPPTLWLCCFVSIYIVWLRVRVGRFLFSFGLHWYVFVHVSL